jgi:hypothetical protein
LLMMVLYTLRRHYKTDVMSIMCGLHVMPHHEGLVPRPLSVG